MWDEDDGLFYDFNFSSGGRKKVRSLATFSPLFAGLADSKQAASIRDNLRLFETPFGLLTCDHDYGYRDRQWNYPVGSATLDCISRIEELRLCAGRQSNSEQVDRSNPVNAPLCMSVL